MKHNRAPRRTPLQRAENYVTQIFKCFLHRIWATFSVCYLERNLKWHENIIITIIIMNNTVQKQNHPAAIQSLYQSSKAYELCEENIRFQVVLSVIFSNACFWNLLCFVMNWDTTSHSSNIYFYKRCDLLFTKQLKHFSIFVPNIKTPFLDIFSLFDGWEINLIFIGVETCFFGKL